MSLTQEKLLIVPLEHSEAFSGSDIKLANKLGASELIYAAVSVFSFDQSGPAESLIDSNPDLEHDVINWLEDVLTSLAHLFLNIRTFHNEQELDEVVYDAPAETLYVTSKTTAVLYGRRRFPTGISLR